MKNTDTKTQKQIIKISLLCATLFAVGCASGTANTTLETQVAAYSSYAPMRIIESCSSDERPDKGFHTFASAIIALENSGWTIKEVWTADGKVRAQKCEDQKCANVLFQPFQNGELSVFPSNEDPHALELLSKVKIWVDEMDKNYKGTCGLSTRQLKAEMDEFGFEFAPEKQTK